MNPEPTTLALTLALTLTRESQAENKRKANLALILGDGPAIPPADGVTITMRPATPPIKGPINLKEKVSAVNSNTAAKTMPSSRHLGGGLLGRGLLGGGLPRPSRSSQGARKHRIDEMEARKERFLYSIGKEARSALKMEDLSLGARDRTNAAREASLNEQRQVKAAQLQARIARAGVMTPATAESSVLSSVVGGGSLTSILSDYYTTTEEDRGGSLRSYGGDGPHSYSRESRWDPTTSWTEELQSPDSGHPMIGADWLQGGHPMMARGISSRSGSAPPPKRATYPKHAPFKVEAGYRL